VDEKGQAAPLGESWGAAIYLGLLAAALLVVGVWWGPLTNWAANAAKL
jgi:hypothetical protein